MAVLEGSIPACSGGVPGGWSWRCCSLRQAAKAMNVSPMTVHRRLAHRLSSSSIGAD